MGDERQSTNESMSSILSAIRENLPQLGVATRAEYEPNAAAELALAQKYTPAWAKLQAETLQGPGKDLARIGRELSREEQLGAADTELAIAKGPGAELAAEARKLQEVVDPEYMAQRKQLADNITRAFGAIDPTKLTGTETEQIARGLNRTGTMVPSAMGTVKNAMAFGDALAKRREEFGRVIDRSTAALPGMRTGITGFEAATRRTLMPNFGTTNYTGIQQPGMANSQNQAGQMLNVGGQLQQQVMSKQKDTWDRVGQGMEMGGKFVGGVASVMCWVARETFGEFSPNWTLFRRWLLTKAPAKLRTLYYQVGPSVAAFIKNKPELRAAMRRVMSPAVQYMEEN